MHLDELIATRPYTVWLALGDSITEYNHCTEGYPNYLQHFETWLRLRFGKRKFLIVNAAVSGSSLRNDLDFALDKVARFRPDFVTAMYGMNDSHAGVAGLARFGQRWDALGEALRASRTPLVLLTQNPIDYGCRIACIETRPDYPQYAAAVVAAAARNDVAVVDSYGVWQQEVLAANPNEHFKLMHDGIHPNHKGHEYFFRIMRAALCSPSPDAPAGGNSPK